MADFDLNDDLVRRLAELLQENGLTEIEYESEGHRIRVSRGGGAAAVAAAPAAPAPAAAAAPAAAPSGPSSDAVPAGSVTSPMVGTAYCAAQPGSAPFVKVGDTVREGQTILIIEAMKVMNQIPAPRAGKVTAVMVEDGQPVEFGEPLLVIE